MPPRYLDLQARRDAGGMRHRLGELGIAKRDWLAPGHQTSVTASTNILLQMQATTDYHQRQRPHHTLRIACGGKPSGFGSGNGDSRTARVWRPARPRVSITLPSRNTWNRVED